MMGDVLESLIRGAKSGKYCVVTLMAAFMFVFQFFVEPNLTKWSMC
jgi:hypothetical protein